MSEKITDEQQSVLLRARRQAIGYLAELLDDHPYSDHEGSVLTSAGVIAAGIIAGTSLALAADMLDDIGYLIQEMTRR